ncbi:MAG: sensor histidine kinase [Magnetovibrionaceae bacterium]
MAPTTIRRKLLLPLALALAALLLAFVASAYHNLQVGFEAKVDESLGQAKAFVASRLSATTESLRATLITLGTDQDLQDMVWLDRREEALNHLLPRLEQIERPGLPDRLFVLGRGGNVFIEPRQPGFFGHPLAFPTADRAVMDETVSSGIAIGREGQIVSRVFVPWWAEERHFGFLGMERRLTDLAPSLQNSLNASVFLMVEKSLYSGSYPEDSLALPWDRFEQVAVISSATNVDEPAFHSVIDSFRPGDSGLATDDLIVGETGYYRAFPLPLTGPRGTPVAQLLVFLDVTEEQEAFYADSLAIVGIVGLLGGALLLFFWILLGKVTNALIDGAEALSRQAESAKTANQAKSEFLAHMSHELRTPLNAILGFSEIIQAQVFGPVGNQRYLDYVSDIHSSGTHLLALINDLLDLSRIEAGKFVLQEDQVDLSSIISECTHLMKPKADEGSLRLSVDLEENLPNLLGDERRLRQVLLNLLGNAVKFTPEGGEISVKAGFDNHFGFNVEVSDTGHGIAPEDLERVLSPFDQARQVFIREHDGVGLGLPLTKGLIEMHGGDLKLTSEVGVGTTVRLNLPTERKLMAELPGPAVT